MITDKNKLRVNTYTHSGEVLKEVILLSINSGCLGYDNTGSPDNFDRKHINSWMKSNYYINGDKIIAQIPINIQNYPNEVQDLFSIGSKPAFLEYISKTQEKVVKTYYVVKYLGA